jgi:cobalt-precorrin-5B (C1)-methyltransferase
MANPRKAATGKPDQALRRGWTTGACATAAAKAAWQALLGGTFPDPVSIRLPRGQTAAFALARTEIGDDWRAATIIKDAGDDPDVTHGAEITATVRRLGEGAGIVFRAGEGVGTVTRAGLPVPPGEPAINPVPRRMMRAVIREAAAAHGVGVDAEITLSVAGGAELAEKTWNPRLGILGGISILGTTGIVVPYSCAAWIHSIHRGVDVARAAGLDHIAGSTGSTSEAAIADRLNLPLIALIDMGDFAGGLLKYVRDHPVPRLTIAGGFAKISKLAQGALDLHSARSEVDKAALAAIAADLGAGGDIQSAIGAANTAAQALEIGVTAGIDLASVIAQRAAGVAANVLAGAPVRCDVAIIDRQGTILAHTHDEAASGE